MQIHIHPDLMWGASFSVPTSVVDRFLLSSEPEQLRALLWVLRHASEQPTTEKMASDLHWTRVDAENAVRFWQDKGLLQSDLRPAPRQSEPEKPARVLPDVAPAKPTPADILQRLNEDKDLEGLFKEAQQKFGRSLGYEGQCTLLALYDTYGLPMEVILILLQYCKDIGKTGNHYIAETGKNWALEEIDTMEKAVEKVELLRSCTSLWKQLAAYAGLSAPKPTAVQSEYLRTWSYELGFSMDMITLAYEEMANHCSKLSFPYINKVLRNWYEKGIKTPQQAAEYGQSFRSRSKENASEPPASYDIEQMERQLWDNPIVKRKKD